MAIIANNIATDIVVYEMHIVEVCERSSVVALTHRRLGVALSAQYPVPGAQVKPFPCSYVYCCVFCDWICGDE